MNSDLLVGHDTWDTYDSMLRIYKLYDLKFHMSRSDSESTLYADYFSGDVPYFFELYLGLLSIWGLQTHLKSWLSNWQIIACASAGET